MTYRRKDHRVGAVVLAAGLSKRFGSPKQLARRDSGDSDSGQPEAQQTRGSRPRTFVRHTTTVMLDAGLEPVVVVYAHPEVHAEVRDLPIYGALNPHPERGLSTSVRSGLRTLLDCGSESSGVLFAPIDQPDLSVDIVLELVAAHLQAPENVVQPTFASRPSSPTLFPRRLFCALLQLEGDAGGSQLLGPGEAITRVEFGDSHDLRDVDTPEQYRRWHAKRDVSGTSS